MERNSVSEVYDEDILVGLDDAAGTVWVMVEVMVLDCVSGNRRKRKKDANNLEMNILRDERKGRETESFCGESQNRGRHVFAAGCSKA